MSDDKCGAMFPKSPTKEQELPMYLFLLTLMESINIIRRATEEELCILKSFQKSKSY